MTKKFKFTEILVLTLFISLLSSCEQQKSNIGRADKSPVIIVIDGVPHKYIEVKVDNSNDPSLNWIWVEYRDSVRVINPDNDTLKIK